jgi:hypothetical protein
VTSHRQFDSGGREGHAVCCLLVPIVEVVQKNMLKYIQGIQKKIKELQPQSFSAKKVEDYRTEVLALA